MESAYYQAARLLAQKGFSEVLHQNTVNPKLSHHTLPKKPAVPVTAVSAPEVSDLDRVRFFKTRICVFHKRGICAKGAQCSYAHDEREVLITPDLAKTRLCQDWLHGRCTSKKCKFAHGQSELRPAESSLDYLNVNQPLFADPCRNLGSGFKTLSINEALNQRSELRVNQHSPVVGSSLSFTRQLAPVLNTNADFLAFRDSGDMEARKMSTYIGFPSGKEIQMLSSPSSRPQVENLSFHPLLSEVMAESVLQERSLSGSVEEQSLAGYVREEVARSLASNYHAKDASSGRNMKNFMSQPPERLLFSDISAVDHLEGHSGYSDEKRSWHYTPQLEFEADDFGSLGLFNASVYRQIQSEALLPGSFAESEDESPMIPAPTPENKRLFCSALLPPPTDLCYNSLLRAPRLVSELESEWSPALVDDNNATGFNSAVALTTAALASDLEAVHAPGFSYSDSDRYHTRLSAPQSSPPASYAPFTESNIGRVSADSSNEADDCLRQYAREPSLVALNSAFSEVVNEPRAPEWGQAWMKSTATQTDDLLRNDNANGEPLNPKEEPFNSDVDYELPEVIVEDADGDQGESKPRNSILSSFTTADTASPVDLEELAERLASLIDQSQNGPRVSKGRLLEIEETACYQ